MLSSKISKLSLLSKRAFNLNSLKLSVNSFSKFSFCHHDTAPVNMIRRPAPEFTGMTWWNGEFKKLSLKDFQGKWLCLFFYPLDFTFVCPTEIVDFNAKAGEFEKLSKHIFIYFTIRLPSSRLFHRLSLYSQRIRT